MTARTPASANFLSAWPSLESRIRAHSSVAVFLDFDGTLVDIAPRPELVKLRPQLREILRRLSRHPRVTLVVVSGRRRAELLQHIGIPGMRYFGLYGWERSASSALPAKTRKALHRARAQMHLQLRIYPEIWIEKKNSTFSIHLLDAPGELQPRVRRKIRSLLKPFRKTLRIVENLRDVEVLPRSMRGKGAAVREFLAQSAFRRAFPIYFGDDLSDESGFVAVRRGASVRVGAPRSTRACYSLKNPREVMSALRKLDAALRRK